MIDKTPMADSGANRRENFRIDNVLPVSLRRVPGGIMPAAHIIPVAAATSSPVDSPWESGNNLSFSELDSTFALMLIEVNAKLDLLLVAHHIQSDAVGVETNAIRLSMTQLLSQINVKLEHLLAAQRVARSEERVRIDKVCLSASGIKLTTEEKLSAGNHVEVRMLFNTGGRPFWVVVGGTVVRARPLATGKLEVAINFTGITEEVEDEISRYALLEQKKQIMARRGIRR